MLILLGALAGAFIVALIVYIAACAGGVLFSLFTPSSLTRVFPGDGLDELERKKL